MPLCVVCTLQMRMISIDATWLRIYRTSNLMCSILTMHIPSNKTMTFTFCLATHTTANSTCFFFIFYFSTLIVVVVVVLKIGRSYKTRAAVSDTVTISIPRPQGGGFLCVCFFFLAKTSIKLTHIFFASVSEYYLSGGDWRSQLCSVHYSAICMAIMIFNWINVEVGNGDLSWWQIHSWFQFNCLLLTMQCAAFYHGWFAKKWLSIIITHTRQCNNHKQANAIDIETCPIPKKNCKTWCTNTKRRITRADRADEQKIVVQQRRHILTEPYYIVK